MDKPVHRTAHLLEQIIEMFLPLFPADDRPDVRALAAAVRAHFTLQQVPMI